MAILISQKAGDLHSHTYNRWRSWIFPIQENTNDPPSTHRLEHHHPHWWKKSAGFCRTWSLPFPAFLPLCATCPLHYPFHVHVSVSLLCLLNISCITNWHHHPVHFLHRMLFGGTQLESRTTTENKTVPSRLLLLRRSLHKTPFAWGNSRGSWFIHNYTLSSRGSSSSSSRSCISSLHETHHHGQFH